MSLQLLRDEIKCWGPCSCETHRPSAVHSPETDPPAHHKRNKTHCRFFLLISTDRRILPPSPPSTSHSLPWGGYAPHKPAVRLQLTEGTSLGWGLCYCERTPPCWSPSKQQAVELLEADVPPGEAQPQEPPGGPEHGESRRQKKEWPREQRIVGERR